MCLEPPDPPLAAPRRPRSGERWGGSFEVVGCENWKRSVRSFRGTVRPPHDVRSAARARLAAAAPGPRILLVVGGAKVPSDLYSPRIVNVAVGNQPHSEVAALAVLLARLLGLPSNDATWPGARQRDRAARAGKKVGWPDGA